MRVYRTVALALTALIGAALIVFAFAAGLPGKTKAVENVTDDFRPVFTDKALKDDRADFTTMQAMLGQLSKQTLPDMAKEKGVPEQAFTTILGTQYPAVGKGLKESPAILPRFDALIGTMEKQAPNFRQADEIPTADLPNTAVTYLYLVPGVLLVLIGGVGLVFSRDPKHAGKTTGALAAAAVLGLVMVVATPLTGVIGKTQDAEKMFDAFRPTFTDQGYQQARTDMDTLAAMATEMRAKTLPKMAEAAGKPVDVYTKEMGAKYPAVGKGLLEIDRILPKFDGMVKLIGKNVKDFQKADHIPTEGSAVSVMPWLILIPGAVVLVAAGAGVLVGRRNSDADLPAREPVSV